MKTWTLSYGEPNYEVHLHEVPTWRYVVEELWEGALGLLGHPCCARLDWIPGWWLPDRVAVLQYRLLNNRLAMLGVAAQRRVEKFPITETHARLIDAEFVDYMRAIFDDD